jgi:ISXO2-like transposase domain
MRAERSKLLRGSDLAKAFAYMLKRWLIGTHAGAISAKHLQSYLDEFAFRHNRRKTNGVGQIAARLIESLVARPPTTMRNLIDHTRRCRLFRSNQLAEA